MKRIFSIMLILAIVMVTAAAAPAAETFSSFYLNGLTLYRAGDYPGAESVFSALLARIGAGHLLAPEVYLYLGKSLMGQKRFVDAMGPLKAAFAARPRRAGIAQAYGEALFFGERYEDCLPVFETAAGLDPRMARKALYYTGIAQLKLGHTADGVAALGALVAKAPGSVEAKSARPMLSFLNETSAQARTVAATRRQALEGAAPGAGAPEKPWTLSVSAGIEYDDNVSLIPDSTVQLPGDVSSRGNGRLVHSVGGSYALLDEGGQNLRVLAEYGGTKHWELDAFDVDAVSGGLIWRRTLRPFQLRAGAYLSRIWVDGSPDSWSWSLAPGVSWQPVRWTWTDLDYRFRASAYDTAPADMAEDRDAVGHSLSARQSFSFPGLVLDGYSTLFALDAAADTSDSDGASYEYDALGAGVTVQQGFPFDLVLVAGCIYREIDYHNPNARSNAGRTRQDREKTFNARLYKKMTDQITVYGGYRKYSNESNIPDFFEYDADVYAAGLRLDF